MEVLDALKPTPYIDSLNSGLIQMDKFVML